MINSLSPPDGERSPHGHHADASQQIAALRDGEL